MNSNKVSAEKISLSGEFLIVGICVGIGVLLLGLGWMFRTPGEVVRVSVSGNEVGSYPINRDRQIVLEGKEKGRNFLIIENGTARIEDADCPDKLCVKMGRISQNGQSLICLPHEVIVEIVAEE